MKTLLIVEDELRIAQIARDYLVRAGFNVLHAADGPAALAMFRHETPALLVLDLGLPGMDGLDVVRVIRKTHNTPLIMLTARGEETDRLIGLELGADDYMVKPFSPKELVARVRAVLRRSEGAGVGSETALTVGEISADPSRMSASISGRALDLTATEFQLLHTLMLQPGRVFTRAQLLDAIRGVMIESYERAIDAHIKNLRKKLEPNAREPRHILTVYGVGYKLNG